jgi:hypothetical protein
MSLSVGCAMAVMQRQPLDATVARRPRRTAGWMLALLGAALLVWQGWQGLEDAEQLRSQRAGLAGLSRASLAQVGAMSSAERQRHAQIEAVATALAQPATTLLDALEAQAAGVLLVRVSHDNSTAALELVARAPDAAARERYLVGLNGVPRLKVVSVADEPPDGAAGAGRAARLRIAARWPEARVP